MGRGVYKLVAEEGSRGGETLVYGMFGGFVQSHSRRDHGRVFANVLIAGLLTKELPCVRSHEEPSATNPRNMTIHVFEPTGDLTEVVAEVHYKRQPDRGRDTLSRK